MRRLVCALFVLLLCACTRASTAAPVTPRDVVLQANDVPTMQKCPQSDRWAGLMLTGQPEMLPTGFATLSDLKAAGATEAWLSMYADDVADCPLLLGSAAPQGRLVYTVAIKFKNASSAAASFLADSVTFPVADSFLGRFTAAGGVLTKGSSTGFGDNSVLAMIAFRGVPAHVALWQDKEFEAIYWGDNVSADEVSSAVGHMNARVH